MKNVLFMHGGGPTAVLNASLAGSLKTLRESGFKGQALFARFGTGGLLRKDVGVIPDLDDGKLRVLSRTPGSAIGSGRDHLEAEDYLALADNLCDLDVGYVVIGGGNGTMDTAKKLSQACLGKGIRVVGVPKTMDNDLSVTDHSPGFLSAAKYISSSVSEVIMDVRGLPIHMVVVEAFGRNAGWITASAALSGVYGYGAPDMLLLPEVPFNEDAFLTRVGELQKEKGCGVIVASEGLKYADGTPIVEPVFKVGRSVYFGDVSSHLSLLITRKLGIKSRSEKPGILGRSSIAWQSGTDRSEAFECGRVSMLAALDGKTGVMSIIRRVSDRPYRSEIVVSDIVDEILCERCMPEGMIDRDRFNVTDEFFSYAAPMMEKDDVGYLSFV